MPESIGPAIRAAAGRWGRAGVLPASDSSHLCAHASRLLNAEADGTIGKLRTSFARALNTRRAPVRPNLRLKLAAPALKGSGGPSEPRCISIPFVNFHILRPQFKRHPLGRTRIREEAPSP